MKKRGKKLKRSVHFLTEMDGSCQVPIAGFAQYDGSEVELTGYIASPDAITSIQKYIYE